MGLPAYPAGLLQRGTYPTRMDRQIRRLVLIISFLTIVVMGGVAGFSLLEHKSVADSLYFVIVTISTVGYGDVAPVTTAGRLIAIFLIICGVGSFVAVAAEIVEILLSRRERQEYLRKISMLLGFLLRDWEYPSQNLQGCLPRPCRSPRTIHGHDGVDARRLRKSAGKSLFNSMERHRHSNRPPGSPNIPRVATVVPRAASSSTLPSSSTRHSPSSSWLSSTSRRNSRPGVISARCQEQT